MHTSKSIARAKEISSALEHPASFDMMMNISEQYWCFLEEI